MSIPYCLQGPDHLPAFTSPCWRLVLSLTGSGHCRNIQDFEGIENIRNFDSMAAGFAQGGGSQVAYSASPFIIPEGYCDAGSFFVKPQPVLCIGHAARMAHGCLQVLY